MYNIMSQKTTKVTVDDNCSLSVEQHWTQAQSSDAVIQR